MNFSQPFAKTQTTFTVIEEQAPSWITHTDASIPRPRKTFTAQLRTWAHQFFPWTGRSGPELDHITQKAAFPVYALVALTVSASTIIFAWLILLFVDHHVKFQSKFLEPSSWLSALMSVNGMALAFALSEGITTAWWYKALCRETTIKDLHRTWVMGSGLSGAIRSGKHFNYVAMATAFLAAGSLNGVFLQNALEALPSTNTHNMTLLVPAAPSLPPGFSGNVSHGVLGLQSPSLALTSTHTSGLQTFWGGADREADAYGSAHNTYWAMEFLNCADKDGNSTCATNITVTGFDADCASHKIPYDLRPSSQLNDSFTESVFSTTFGWDPSQPYILQLEGFYKASNSCVGDYTAFSCNLHAARLSVPIQIAAVTQYSPNPNFNYGEYTDAVIATQLGTTFANDTVVERLKPSAAEGEGMSTFRGIAEVLATRYNSTINLSYANSSWMVLPDGEYADVFPPMTGWLYEYYSSATDLNNTDGSGDLNSTYHAPKSPDVNSPDFCNVQFLGLDDSVDTTGSSSSDTVDVFESPVLIPILESVRQYMFAASVIQFTAGWESDSNDYNSSAPYFEKYGQIVAANRTEPVLRYTVRYQYWAASCTVTTAIILVILPTFYGFWLLEHRPTLSPFETATAFKTPGIYDADMKRGTRVALKELGMRSVHELDSPIASPALSSDPSRTTYIHSPIASPPLSADPSRTSFFADHREYGR